MIRYQGQQQAVDRSAQGHENRSAELASVHDRLDDLTRRIDQLMRKGPAAYAPPHARMAVEEAGVPMSPAAPPLAPPMPAAPRVHLPPALDHAVAEIAARRRALNSRTAQQKHVPQPQAAPPPPPPPMPAQDLSGLEDQLRYITDQIETLRTPRIEEAINALRIELGEIGHALSEAMPRQAIDTLERQISGLSQRIENGRQAGIDRGALANIERGLAEVRDGLRGLTPAENLVGFNDAVAGLAHKIDLIVAQRDPATFQQLEHAITTLREMAAHVASNEAVGQLAGQVRALSEKIDQVAQTARDGDTLAYLDQRISALADALAERQQDSGAVPPQLEALVQSLSGKIEQIEASRSDSATIGKLEDRVVQLVEKLDQSQSRLAQIEPLERGLGDLLVQVEELRAARQSPGPEADGSPVADELKQDIARTQDAVEAVHGTLGHLVDRLAMIEKAIRDAESARAPTPAEDSPAPPFGKLGARAVSEPAPEPAPLPPVQPTPAESAAAAKPARPPMPKAMPLQAPESEQATAEPRPQIIPQRRPAAVPVHDEATPDLPLEPGSGRPKFNARIAASQAALGGTGPAALPPGGKSSFIAAARRAARAALQQGSSMVPRADPQATPQERPPQSLRGKLMKRAKSLLIAASIIAIVVGGFQVIGNFFDFRSIPASETAKTGQVKPNDGIANAPAAGVTRTVRKIEADRPTTSTSAPGGAVTPGRGPAGAPGPAGFARIAPPLFSPPMLGAPSDAAGSDKKPDVTGSIAKAPAGPQTDPRTSSDGLPAAIGSTRLRNAALAGDAGAVYEVAVRFAEGRGVPANMQEAAQWFARAAELGLAPAQFRYASMLEKGQGVRKNLTEARRYYRAAAEQGHGKAMHNLAVLYAEGIDGKPDYASAAKWFRQAALRGVADSQYNLGVLAARGLGTEKNFVESYKWFALAAAHGDQESARKRDEIASQLDDEALATVREAVKNFRVQPQPKTAITVPQPEGGWDRVADEPATAPKAKAQPQHETQPSHPPLSLGSFTVGKR